MRFQNAAGGLVGLVLGTAMLITIVSFCSGPSSDRKVNDAASPATEVPDGRTICAVRGQPIISYRSSPIAVVEGEVRCTVAARHVKISGLFYDASGRLIGAHDTYADLNEIPAGGSSSFSIWLEVNGRIASHNLQVEAMPR